VLVAGIERERHGSAATSKLGPYQLAVCSALFFDYGWRGRMDAG